MTNDTTNKINKIVTDLTSTSDSLPPEAIVEDPSNDLRLNVLSFFNSRIKSIESQEKLKLLVQKKLEEKLETTELDIKELKELFVVLSRETINASEDILKIAHPAQGQSALADDFSKKMKNSKDEENLEESLNPDVLRKLDSLFRFFQSMKTEN